MNSIAILISSRKGGHKFPAKALANYINNGCAARAQVINLLDHIPTLAFFDALSRWGDINLRSLWRAGYASLTNPRSPYLDMYRKAIRKVISQQSTLNFLRKIIGSIDIILSLQPEINTIAGILKKLLSTPFHTLIMDYSAHAGWVEPTIDKYYVANFHVKDQLISYGVLPDHILITGAPIQPGFDTAVQIPIDKQRRLLGIIPGRPTVLIVAGYLGKMVDFPVIINLLQMNIPDIQILVVTGKNIKMHHQLLRANYPNAYLYYNLASIHPVMRAADLVISKPGGMIIADCLAHGKPMLLIDPKGGALQESIFANMVEHAGAAYHLKDAGETGEQVRHLFENSQAMITMAEKSHELGKLNRSAASTIAEQLLKTRN